MKRKLYTAHVRRSATERPRPDLGHPRWSRLAAARGQAAALAVLRLLVSPWSAGPRGHVDCVFVSCSWWTPMLTGWLTS